MNNHNKANMNWRVSSDLRDEFKRKAKALGMTCEGALDIAMREWIDRKTTVAAIDQRSHAA